MGRGRTDSLRSSFGFSSAIFCSGPDSPLIWPQTYVSTACGVAADASCSMCTDAQRAPGGVCNTCPRGTLLQARRLWLPL